MSSKAEPEKVSRKDAAVAKKIRTFGLMAALIVFCLAGASWAADIKVVPSAAKVNPGETFYADIVVEGIPSEGLGAVQFRLNVTAPGSNVATVSDTLQGQPADISVSSPLIIGPATTSRSGVGDFFWNAKGSHGILVIDNEALLNGSGLYTLGHTNGAAIPSGSGAVARFQINAGNEAAAEKIVLSLSDVVLLDGSNVYPVDSNTGATVDLKCYTQAPNLIGLSQTAAAAALTAARLSLGNVYEVDNTGGTHALNTVLIQSAEPGITILCETPVDFAVNTPPAEPGNVHAADKAGDESGIVVLSWLTSSSTDAAGYRVYNASGVRLAEIANAASTGTELSGLVIGAATQLRITTYDTYGNESAGVSVLTTAHDDLAPRIAVSGVTEGAYYASDVQPVIAVQEANLSVQEITLNGLAYDQSPITLEAAYLLRILATDTSGNSTAKEIRFTIDKTPPVITVAGIEKNGYYNSDLSLAITVSETNLETTESTLNGTAYASGTVITAENNYQLVVHAVDKAGNSASETYPFLIDKTRPVSAITTGTPQYENAGVLYVAGATIFTISGIDPGAVPSGVEKLEYRTNSGIWNGYQSPVTFAGVSDGPLTMDYHAVDRATNVEDFHTLSVTLDTAAPLTTLTPGEPQYTDAAGATYVTSNTAFALSASDSLSGLSLTEYRLDTGAWTLSAPFTVSAEGAHTILYRSKDNLGNTEADHSFTAIVDNTPPVTTITTGDPKYTAADGKLYLTSATTFALSATDSLSGVAATEYRIDGGTWTTYAPFSLAAEGMHTIDYRSQDNLTNMETSKTLTVIVDNTPPVTTISTGDPKYTTADGKHYITSASMFTLAATDNLSGVALTEYRIDGGAWTTYAPFALAADGTHSIDYYSKDNATNIETFKSLTVIVDNASPVTTIMTGDPKYTAADGKLYVTTSTTFTLAATDNVSGVAMTEYRIDNGQWTAYAPFTVTGEGAHIIEYRSQDNVSNTETFNTLAVIVDNTPPVTAITTGDPKYTTIDGKLYVTSTSTFMVSATDNLSGVAKTEYRIDNGQWTVNAPFKLEAEGTRTIDYRSQDNVANLEAFKTLTVIVDNTPPVTTISTGDPKHTAADAKLYVTSTSTFTLAATDNLSGVASTEYRIDGGAWNTFAPFTIVNEGTHTIDYYSKDNVNNTEDFRTLNVIADDTAPESTITVGTPQYESDGKLYVSGGTGISITASDAGSGVKKTEYSIDGGQWNTYTSIFILGSYADGTHTIRYRSIDNVGNPEKEKELVVTLDKTAPNTSISASDPLIEGVVNTVSPVTFFTLTAVDDLSGVSSAMYRIDDGQWQTYTGSFSLADLKAGEHKITYRATDNVLNEENQRAITVRLIIIEVEKKIAADSVVLVGVDSDKTDQVQKQVDVQRLGAILSSINVNYSIAGTMEEFTAALRSGGYNTYILIDMKEPLINQEIRESVHYGDGLIFIKTRPFADPFLDDVFGMKFSGKTTNSDLVVDLLSNPISSEGTLQTSGKSVVSTVSTEGVEIFGSVADKHNTYPAIVFNQYQNGKVLLYTFDLLSATDQSLASALLIQSLNFVRPEAQTSRALGSLPITITVTNSTEPVEVKVKETLPAGTTVNAVIPPVTPVDNTLTWQKSLASGEKAGFRYHLNLPDMAGDYLTKTELSYNNNGFFRPYGEYQLNLTVENDHEELLDKIIADVRSLEDLTISDTHQATRAVDALLLIKVNAADRKEAEDNIRAIVKAVDELRKISADVSTIRNDLDELLKVWEKKWYLMEPLAE